MNLVDTIGRYTASLEPDHRYRSWEHCYRHFSSAGPMGLRKDPEKAAMHLAFYLASWGMYRGSAFLLQFAYTIHLPVVEVVRASRFRDLWQSDFGSDGRDDKHIACQLELVSAIRDAYQPYAARNGSRPATDTLVTKVMLGTLGCVPACDDYFTTGLREAKIPYSSVNRPFFVRMLKFCSQHMESLRSVQARLQETHGMKYPLMKLVDMHFWQWGVMVKPR